MNLSFLAHASFRDPYAAQVIGVTRDLFEVVSVVNALEDWSYFKNEERRAWRKALDRLALVRDEAEKLDEYLERAGHGGWMHALVRGDVGSFNAAQVLDDLPEGLRTNQRVLDYILWLFSAGPLACLIDDAARGALRAALGR
ncbi:MAG: hypothetical protein HY906_01730 [Deltaproteobacteria bacterium]|nr:hypothetical protein [Deltaproteobacteria bacterium]